MRQESTTTHVRLTPVPFAEIEETVRRHLGALPGPIDSFVEEHVLAAHHAQVEVDGATAGFVAIHDRRLITQFALTESHRPLGPELFGQVRRLSGADAALAPTSDPHFLAHALVDHRRLLVQAFLFRSGPLSISTPGSYAIHPAAAADAETIRAHSSDFFEPVERRIAAGELRLVARAGELVGFGLVERGRLVEGVASIGMFTLEHARRTGVGTATIALLRAECERRGLRAVAGCWAGNVGSKRALDRAGMETAALLLRLEY